jgi:methyltransferase
MRVARAVALAALFYAPMIVEGVRARRNEQRQFARGGVEPRGDVYELMRIAYPGAFAAMVAEGVWREPATGIVIAGAAVFAGAKALKWAAILALGDAWTFRIVIVPAAPLVARGPYRFLRHPNYVAVVAELIGAALLSGAWIAGPAALVGFGALLARRIAVEDRALAAASKQG